MTKAKPTLKEKMDGVKKPAPKKTTKKETTKDEENIHVVEINEEQLNEILNDDDFSEGFKEFIKYSISDLEGKKKITKRLRRKLMLLRALHFLGKTATLLFFVAVIMNAVILMTHDTVLRNKEAKFDYCYKGLFTDQSQVDELTTAVSNGVVVSVPDAE